MEKVTKENLIGMLAELYDLQTIVNVEEIKEKQLEALGVLTQLKLSYREGYELLRKYSHSDKEFNIIMKYARPVLV